MFDWHGVTQIALYVTSAKTKEMRICFKQLPLEFHPITIKGEPVEPPIKLLGCHTVMSWEEHYMQDNSKASKGCDSFTLSDLKTYNAYVISLVVEYAVPVWHSGLTKLQSQTII